MASFIVPFLLTLALFPLHHLYTEQLYSSQFGEFKLTHSREYSSQEEHELRYETFRKNVDFINQRNAENRGYTLAVNKFADWHEHELAALFEAPSTNLSSFANTETLEASGDYPSALDWTEYGVVNEVKDQITCQVSSVFATVAAIESMTAITSGKFIAMSEQQLMDCIPAVSSCTGNSIDYIGNIAEYFEHPEAFITYEAEYPYEAEVYTCRQSYLTVAGQTDGLTIYQTYQNVEVLKTLVARQPVVVSIYADTTDFVFYNGGVYNPPTCTGEINHSMLLVGYLTPDYSKDPMQLSWKLKNSFGLDWGDNGYMQIIRSDAEPVTGDPGICGIYTNVFFPTAKTTS